MRTRLAPGGVVVTNAIGAIAGPGSRLFRSIYKTYRTAFPTVLVHPTILAGDQGDEQYRNLILVATDKAAPGRRPARGPVGRRSAARRRACPTSRSRSSTGATARYPTADVPVLTDDYAPTDALLCCCFSVAASRATSSPARRRPRAGSTAARAGGRASPGRRRARAPSRAPARSRGSARSRASARPGGRGTRRRRRRRAGRTPAGTTPSRRTAATGAAPGPSGTRRARARRPRRCRSDARELERVPALAELVEERPIGVLRRVLEVAREPVQDDRRAALPHGEGVAPQPQHEAECDRRDGDRVEPLARLVVVLPRHADHDRVERLRAPVPSAARPRAAAPRRARRTVDRRTPRRPSPRGRGPAGSGGAGRPAAAPGAAPATERASRSLASS